MQNADPSSAVQSIARAGRVLRALEGAPDGLALRDLAPAVGLPKSTVHRLVAALGAEGLVRNGPDGRVRLGAGLVRLGASAQRSLPTEMRPVLESLHARTGETVDLAVLDGRTMRFVDQIAAPHRLRAVSTVDARFPLHCTANGKALLAALPPGEVDGLLARRLRRYTPATITTRAALHEDLARVRETGVAVDREEHTTGICAVGVAVSGPAGPVAALSVPVPTARFAGEEEIYAGAVLEASADAAKQLDAEGSRR